MKPERRQQILAAALVGVLIVLLWWRLGSGLAPGSGTGRVSLFGGSRTSVGEVAETEILELASLDPEVRNYQVRRDPFRFGEVPRPVAPPPVAPAPRQVIQPPPPPQVVDLGPQPPPVDLSYLGKFGPKKRPIGVLTDGENIFIVREGDIVSEQFKVMVIGVESVDLGFVDFPDVPAQRLGVGS